MKKKITNLNNRMTEANEDLQKALLIMSIDEQNQKKKAC